MKLLAITILILLTNGVFALGDIDQQWQQYQLTYGQQFTRISDKIFRKSIFVKNLIKIEKHNARYRKRLETYEMGLNQFTIYTEAEFRPYTDGIKGVGVENFNNISEPTFPQEKLADIPTSLDWRSKGVINAVKNQGPCGCCWIFASISALESAYAIKKGQHISLSEQQLLDCLKGCKGGHMENAYKYILSNNGVNYENSYPGYNAKEGTCRFDPHKPLVTVDGNASNNRGYLALASRNEQALQKAVAIVGPIVVGIEANSNFQQYKSGVFYESSPCNTINHAVVIIGYGTENGQDYWLVRNSWGPSWGEQGYGKMARNKNNNCQIASNALYPTI